MTAVQGSPSSKISGSTTHMPVFLSGKSPTSKYQWMSTQGYLTPFMVTERKILAWVTFIPCIPCWSSSVLIKIQLYQGLPCLQEEVVWIHSQCMPPVLGHGKWQSQMIKCRFCPVYRYMERSWCLPQTDLQENAVSDNEMPVHQCLWPVCQEWCVELQVHICIQPWPNIIGCLLMVLVTLTRASMVGPATSSPSPWLLITGIGSATLFSGSSSAWSSSCTVPNKTLEVKNHSIDHGSTAHTKFVQDPW